ncbi:MAG: sce7726 family protein [Eubacteriales bacterium]|nr:sce7726 family protein [Eubacteriales bacterium]
MDNSSIALNRVFTQTTFRELFDAPSQTDTYISVVKRYVQDPKGKENEIIISEIYRYLSDSYRNEYFYKNTLLNKLLLGVHSPSTTTALTEVPVGKSKADFVLINGKAVVYEIKTALDTFERLETQLSNYYKAFDHVAVLTDEKSKNTILKILQDTPVGIYLMTKRNQISTIKKPELHTSQLRSDEIFKVMNKNEYETVLTQFYPELPSVPPVKYYQACKRMFCDLDISMSYPAFIKQLKRRNRIEMEEFKHVPYELKFLIYFSKFKKDDYKNLHEFLKTDFEG